ncbi:MAG: ParA family protein [Deltaproteobacteria bacterium]|jgi:chromosome partitioning protein|nr:ParA family protein [Deltaproteobacteria bacterium]
MNSSGTRSARVIAIANQKGGVGKTTTAVTLASALTRMDKRVLLLDLDPHACASVHLRYFPDELTSSVNDIFAENRPGMEELWNSIRLRHSTQEFDVAPATIRLAELEVDLRNRKGKGAILQQALGHVRGEYDFIILDCPPHVGILLVNALVACDLLVVPIQTDFLALHGLKLLFDTIKVLNKVLPVPICYRVLPTLFDRRARACARVLELLELKMSESMFKTVIGMDTHFRDASAQGRVIYELFPESRGAQEYEDLAREITQL